MIIKVCNKKEELELLKLLEEQGAKWYSGNHDKLTDWIPSEYDDGTFWKFPIFIDITLMHKVSIRGAIEGFTYLYLSGYKKSLGLKVNVAPKVEEVDPSEKFLLDHGVKIGTISGAGEYLYKQLIFTNDVRSFICERHINMYSTQKYLQGRLLGYIRGAASEIALDNDNICVGNFIVDDLWLKVKAPVPQMTVKEVEEKYKIKVIV